VSRESFAATVIASAGCQSTAALARFAIDKSAARLVGPIYLRQRIS